MRAWLLLLFVLSLLALIAAVRLGAWLAAPATVPVYANAIVVLGGDGGSGRALKAGELFRAGFATRVVLTGSINTGAALDWLVDPRVQLLIGMGVPYSALLFDSVSRNSWEEAVNTRRMMDENGWRRVLVVSDPPHLRRLALAWGHNLRGAGQQFVLIASDAKWWQADAWWRDERSVHFVAREILAVVYYAWCIVLEPAQKGVSNLTI